MAEHAKLGASGFKKWSTCTMSVALEEKLPDEESEFAAEGTCAHGVAEVRLFNWLHPHLEPRPECRVEDYDKYFNGEFNAYVQEFVDYCKDRITALREEHGALNVTVLLEQRLDFSRWVPQGFGTGDVVVIVPGKVLVIDLKYGQGVLVHGKGNGQLRLYGLGAYQQYHILYDFTEVEVVIHQPRLENVTGEVIQVEGPDGLLTWADEVVVPRAAIAWAALHGDYSKARFSPGDHCAQAFCKARFQCAARARYMLELAEQPFSLEDPDLLTIEQLESVYDRADAAIKWASDVKRFLLKSAANGAIQLNRYQLVEGRSHRTITDPVAAAQKLMHNGYSAEAIYKEPMLVGITELERVVGAKKLTELLGDLLYKPAGAPTLALRGSGKKAVPARPEGTAQEAFGDLD